MSISKITAEDLTHMSDTEGLIIQGCGGNLQEWLDGINGILTDEKILRNGSKFTDIYTFENNGLTNLLFPFGEDVDIDIGKLSMWRLQTHDQFAGKWLSDYVDNYLGGFVQSDGGINMG